MNKKIKNFMCKNVNATELTYIEEEINSFTKTHDVIDIKVSTLCNSFGAVVIYTVIYIEEEE